MPHFDFVGLLSPAWDSADAEMETDRDLMAKGRSAAGLIAREPRRRRAEATEEEEEEVAGEEEAEATTATER